jgi:hypothetical protein
VTFGDLEAVTRQGFPRPLASRLAWLVLGLVGGWVLAQVVVWLTR